MAHGAVESVHKTPAVSVGGVNSGSARPPGCNRVEPGGDKIVASVPDTRVTDAAHSASGRLAAWHSPRCARRGNHFGTSADAPDTELPLDATMAPRRHPELADVTGNHRICQDSPTASRIDGNSSHCAATQPNRNGTTDAHCVRLEFVRTKCRCLGTRRQNRHSGISCVRSNMKIGVCSVRLRTQSW